jgi:cell division protein FtsL
MTDVERVLIGALAAFVILVAITLIARWWTND